jgi:hypothetical protein
MVASVTIAVDVFVFSLLELPVNLGHAFIVSVAALNSCNDRGRRMGKVKVSKNSSKNLLELEANFAKANSDTQIKRALCQDLQAMEIILGS